MEYRGFVGDRNAAAIKAHVACAYIAARSRFAAEAQGLFAIKCTFIDEDDLLARAAHRPGVDHRLAVKRIWVALDARLLERLPEDALAIQPSI